MPDGGSQEGEATVSDFDLADKLVPEGAVDVIYVPAAPDQSAIFIGKWLRHFLRVGE